MRIQNYQTNCNNQPKFKSNVVVTNRVVKAISNRCSDISDEVLQIALDSGHVIRPKFAELPVFKTPKGYVVPDVREPKGAALFAANDEFNKARSLSAQEYIRQQDNIEAAAEDLSNHSDTVVLDKIPELTAWEKDSINTRNFLKQMEEFELEGLDGIDKV